jgi:8-oxo-dGTP diphosphatase
MPVPASSQSSPTRAALHVVCAIIWRDGRVLLAKRPAGKRLGGLWEFPGGKVEPGERAEDALAREIHEELRCMIRVERALPVVSHEYDWGVIALAPFVCRIDAGSEEPHPHEHEELMWASLPELDAVDLAPADVPVLEWLRKENL